MSAQNSPQKLVELRDLRFQWRENADVVIDIEQLDFNQGEHVFIQGASGSGKSTLLNIIGGVLVARQGKVQVLGQQLSALSATQRDRLRADHIGFIFQQFNLIPYLSILENVMIPCRFSETRQFRSIERSGTIENEARFLLSHLFDSGGPDLNQKVTELSVGQQQRVAAARALMGQPELVIADEPTSSLDFDSRQAFMNLLFNEVNNSHSTLLFVSHDPSHRNLFHQCIDMRQINRRVAVAT